MGNTDSLKGYFEHGKSWEDDRLSRAYRSQRVAWSVAAVGATIAVVSVAAVAFLTPLKTVEPFVIRVDNSTGIVDVVNSISNASDSQDDAVTKYFAAKYVRARENYSFQEAEENFRSVALLSLPTEQQRFAAYYRGSNPDSPQVTYGRSGTARVNVKSISVINKHVVTVRYLREVRRGEELKVSHWIATLTFSYLSTPMAAGDRLVNPLGFAVSDYRSDPEAVQ